MCWFYVLMFLQCLLAWYRKVPCSGTRPEALWEFNFKILKQVKSGCLKSAMINANLLFLLLLCLFFCNAVVIYIQSRDTVRMVVPNPCVRPDNIKMSTRTRTLTATCFRSPPSTTSTPLWSWAWRWPWLVTLMFWRILATVFYDREHILFF